MTLTGYLLLGGMSLPAACATGWLSLRGTGLFIARYGGSQTPALQRLFFYSAYVVFFMATAFQQPGLLVVPYLVLLNAMLVFSDLDTGSRWLPLEFTLPFALGSLLLPGEPAWLHAISFAVMWAPLALVRRGLMWRHQKEVMGAGDVWLIAGLSAWLTVPVSGVLTVLALALILLFYRPGRDLPLAPALSLFTGVYCVARPFLIIRGVLLP
ncbi:hypothetical protein KX75_19890 [Salmonella enterica subsp. enterica]|nr:hypothetical protein [Salmonella enterica subsp. enterica serovar Mikawasima]EDN7229136.1 hypothetical protein [Salmonella enterica subsp. enterica serovar Mikawasima]